MKLIISEMKNFDFCADAAAPPPPPPEIAVCYGTSYRACKVSLVLTENLNSKSMLAKFTG